MIPSMASAEQQRESLNIQLLVDSIPSLIHTGRPDGYLDYFNKRWLEYFGATLEQVSGWNWRDFIHAEDVEGIVARWLACLASGEIFEYETRVRRADGEYRWMFHCKVPLRDGRGNIVKWYGSSLDIDERKTAEAAVRRSEAYLAEAQRLSHTGSFGWKIPSGEIFWSDETFRIFEYDHSVKPTIDSMVQRVHPKDRADVKEVISRAFAGAPEFEHAYRLLLPDGRVKHVHAIAHVLQDKSGNREFIGAVTDITERKTTEDKIRRLVEADILGIFMANVQGEIVEANQAFLQMLQYDRQDLVLGRLRWTDLTPAELRERDERALTEALAAGVFHPYEKEFLRKDGSRVPVLIGGALFQSANEGVVFVLDLSEQKRAEEGLRQSEERFRLVLESIGAQVITTTLEGELDFVNQPVLDYFGKTMEQLKGWRTTDVLHPDDLASAIAVWKDSIEKGLSYDVDHRFRRSDGVYRWFHVRGRPERDVLGSIVRWYAFLTDIEDRKTAEGKIREQEAELRQMLDLTPQHVHVLTADARLFYTNEIALKYHGSVLHDWQLRPLIDWRIDELPITLFHPDDRERVMCELKSTLSSGSAHETEARLLRNDGKYLWFLFRYNPLRDEQGRVVRWYVAGTDIEDRKQAEEKLQQENAALRDEINQTSMFDEIVGTSPALTSVLSRISKVAPSDSTVIITGETGTGKELVARAIHRRSDRRSRGFVSVNCAAIPRELIASELFGHEKGAFTGATQQRLGRFELANGGTLFLDEVGELPAETQIALLRVLQEHEFERVGGTRPIRADVRVIASTNRDLQAAISAGSFRSDLFYRLNVFPIEMPSLRERRADIPLLVEYFIDRYARKAGKNIRRVNKKTLELLQLYPWPGNIRELQNVIERSVILCETEIFSIDESWLSKQPSLTEPKNQMELPRSLLAREKEMIEAALKESRGRIFGPTGAAAKLGIPRSTLESKIRSLKINKNRFRPIPGT
jgi:formate hydrogenlyase transcriptional activator